MSLYPEIDMASEGSAGPYEGIPQLLDIWKNMDVVDLAPLGLAGLGVGGKVSVPKKPEPINPRYQPSQDIVANYQDKLFRLIRKIHPKRRWAETKGKDITTVGRTREHMSEAYPDPVRFISNPTFMWMAVQRKNPKRPETAIDEALARGLFDYYATNRPRDFEDTGDYLPRGREVIDAMLPNELEKKALAWQAMGRNRPQLERYWSKEVFDDYYNSLRQLFDPMYMR